MNPTATTQRSRFKENRLLQGLLLVYLVMWIAMSVSPVDRIDWLLENLLVFVLFAFLIATERVWPLSGFSYSLILLFLMLHTVGAHYTYGQVPLGYWLMDAFQFGRNHFDRIAHFCFGLLFAYPLRELFTSALRAHGAWLYYLPIEAVLAMSAFFELLEAWIAQSLPKELAEKYLGSQGDFWDSQNDMFAALVGSCFAMAFTALRERRQRPS